MVVLTRSRVVKLEKQNDRLWAELGRTKARLGLLEGPGAAPDDDRVPAPRRPTKGAYQEPPPEVVAPRVVDVPEALRAEVLEELEAEKRGLVEPVAEEAHVEEAPASGAQAAADDPVPGDPGPGDPSPVPPPVPAAGGVAVETRPPMPTVSLPTRQVASATRSFESFVGGRVLLVVGVIVVLFGLGFLLKVAIDRGLIGPAARIGVGAAAGVGALVGGHLLRKRGFDVFGQALMGGGLGALFLCVRFATINYGFIHQYTGFGICALLTAVGTALALWQRAPLLAYIGFFGGFLAPAFLSTGSDQLERLMGWLIVLDLGVLVVLTKQRWRGLDLMALFASLGYFLAWEDTHYAAARHDAAILAIGALTGALLLVSIVPALLNKRPVLVTSLASALLAGLFGTWGAHQLLFPDQRMQLGAAVGALALVYFGAGYLRSRREEEAGTDAVSLYAFGLAAAATAVPVLMKGHAVAPALSFAGLAAIVVAGKRRQWVFLGGGLAMIVFAVADLLMYRLPPHDTAFVPFANGEFYAFAAPCIALVLGGLLLFWLTDWEAPATLLLTAGLWLYAPLLSAELWMHFDLGSATYGAAAAADYGPASAAAAAALFGVGIAWVVRGRKLAALLLPAGPLFVAGVLAFALLLGGHHRPFLPFLNVVFLAGLAVAAAPVLVAWLARNDLARKVLTFVALGIVFVFLTRDIQEWGEFGSEQIRARSEWRFRANVWISIAWAAYGAALVVAGFARDRAGLRWAGLVVFGLTLLKVFIIDMSELDTIYRIGSFLVLGVLLVGASFLYQRARQKDDDPPPEA